MQAGVVANKPCFKDFHCIDCRFNQAMTRVCRENQEAREKHLPGKRKASRFVFWQDRLRQMPLSRRPCIHHMKGRIDFKACPRSYHCIDCEFDQFFQDRFKVFARVEEVGFKKVNGFELPSGYYLSPGHTWIKLEGGGVVSLGIDDFAARLLGTFDSLSAPLMGKTLSRGKAAFTLGRDRHRVTFDSPVSGVVTEVNPQVLKNPSAIAGSPYIEGWILTLFCPDLKKDLKSMMFMDTAKKFMADVAGTLHHFMEERTGLKAADGGELVPDIFGSLPDVTWEELIALFLSSRE